ncbi:uroporphyrinogen decarboxylase [Occultella aeris]|uniref:uroporphyrinogen decarboxylase n=1 Tax=Occultella aeris TaxID=2761496 RepID=UPI001E5FF633|nr:uroporphyrinogen decarboxylase [Occultella aeris]
MTLLPADHPLTGATASSPLVRAYSGERSPTTPVWFMRQAGRSLPEYRALRTGIRMLEACLDPDLVTEITLQPVRRHGVDAAIFFSDIVVPLRLIGVDVDIVPGKGPVLAHPVRTAADVAALRALTPDGVPAGLFEPVTTAVGRLVGELGSTPLIGFAGAPFTLAAYLVEGGPSKDQLAARTLMHSEPEVWADLMSWLAELTGAFLLAQISAGASAAQLFDSWAGGLSLADYTALVAPHSSAALAPVRDLRVPGASTGVAANGGRVPTVHFGVGTGHLLGAMHDVGVDVVGVDYRTPLDAAAAVVPGVPLQGNVDPALLAAPWPVLKAHVHDVLARGAAAPAHVLNLGHGVPPDTDPEVLTRIVETVHAAADR